MELNESKNDLNSLPPCRSTSQPSSEGREDVSEAETLRRLGKMDQFNRWMWSQIEPWVGQDILEVGCGLGNFTRFMADRKSIVGLDVNEEHLQEFRRRNPDLSQVELHLLDAGDERMLQLGRERFDSIVCLNVLEHVEQDEKALKTFLTLLKPGGYLALLVPAFPFLFGTLDLNGPHFRRYTRQSLRCLIEKTGYQLLRMKYFNLFGIPGWWFCGKILKRPILPAGGLGLYEKWMPLIRRIEEWSGPPFGLSLIAIARKPD